MTKQKKIFLSFQAKEKKCLLAERFGELNSQDEFRRSGQERGSERERATPLRIP